MGYKSPATDLKKWRNAWVLSLEGGLKAHVAELLAVPAECAAWLDKMPEATQGSATGEALQAIVELDLDELSAIEPPRCFGRD